MDELTPMDSEYREVPPEPTETDPHYYGTGPQPPHKKGSAVLVVVVVIVVFAANFLVYWFRNHTARNQENTDPAASTQETEENQTIDLQEPEPGLRDGALNIRKPYGPRLEPKEIYRKTAPSIVQVSAGGKSLTGIVLTSDGYILTNAVDGDRAPTVTLHTGESVPASVRGSDGFTDLSVLKVDGLVLRPAELGDGMTLGAGETVYSLSYPFGTDMEATFTQGMIASVTFETAPGGTEVCILQTDGVLAQPKIRGPVINAYGQVVGIHVGHMGELMSLDSSGSVGIAMPMAQTDEVVTELMEYGYVRGRVNLGIEVADLTEPQRAYWELPQGVIVSDVRIGSGAAAAGIRLGDVVLSVGDEPVSNAAEYYGAVEGVAPGEEIRLVLYRKGRQLTVIFREIG